MDWTIYWTLICQIVIALSLLTIPLTISALFICYGIATGLSRRGAKADRERVL